MFVAARHDRVSHCRLDAILRKELLPAGIDPDFAVEKRVMARFRKLVRMAGQNRECARLALAGCPRNRRACQPAAKAIARARAAGGTGRR